MLKSFKQMRQKLAPDTGAGIAHNNSGMCLGAGQVCLDRSARGGELDRVGEEIPDNLLKSVGVAGHQASIFQLRFEHHAFDLGDGLNGLQCGFDNPGRVYGAHGQPDFTGGNPRDVQQILDQFRLRPCAALDDSKTLDALFVGHGAAQTQVLGPAKN